MPREGKTVKKGNKSPILRETMAPFLVAKLDNLNVDELYAHSREAQRNFASAEMWDFLQLSKDWPEPALTLCKQFVENFDAQTGKSKVNEQEVELTEKQVSTLLRLPTAELPAEETMEEKDATNSQLSTLLSEPHAHFKSGKEALTKDGWRTNDAITPQLVMWMRFVNKRLALKVHFTYLHSRLLEATMGTIGGCKYNWASFVTKTMVQECLSKKGKAGEKFLSAAYLSYIVKKQLNIPMNEKELFAAKTPVPKPILTPEANPKAQPMPVVISPPATIERPIVHQASSSANVID